MITTTLNTENIAAIPLVKNLHVYKQNQHIELKSTTLRTWPGAKD